MQIGSSLIINSLLLGVGLAVDSFIIALANGMNGSGKAKGVTVPVLLAVFQFAAVMIGWVTVYYAYAAFAWIKIVFSWVAVAVFLFMGIKMLISASRGIAGNDAHFVIGVRATLIQCAAASVDALTVGFTVEEYELTSVLICSSIIAIVTFAVYIMGHYVGRRFGMRFGGAAGIVGGIAFIAIAVEIIVTTYV